MRDDGIDKPQISIVMSFYKEPLQWIEQAVESIQNQTYKNIEFLVLCDNPEYEDAIRYLKEVEKTDSRVRLIINESNLGLTKTLNKGIELSSGKYIARMDADDISLIERLEKQVRYLEENPDIAVCATDVHVIDEEGAIIRRNKYRSKYNPNWNFICNAQAHPSVMFRAELKSLRDKIYNEEFTYAQDYELWQYLILHGHKINTCREALLLYRRSKAQITSVQKIAQNEFFKRSHRDLINGWLIKNGVISETDCGQLKVMLEKVSEAFNRFDGNDRHILSLIIYVLYFSIGTYEWKYRFKFLIDKNLIMFRIRFVLTFRLFISSRTRKRRCGFL